MYTIRHILGQTLGLTKSEVRWDALSDISGKYNLANDKILNADKVKSSGQTALEIRTDITALEIALEDTTLDAINKLLYEKIITALTDGLKQVETQTQNAMASAVPARMPDTTENGGIKPLPTNLKNAAKLSEGSAYNNIDTASALVFLRTILNTQDTAGVKDLISSTLNLQVRDGNKDDAMADASGNRATLGAELAKFGYVFGASKWADKEVSDLKDFLEDHLGKEGYKSLRDTGSVKADIKKTALDRYKGVEVINSMVVKPAKANDLQSLLQNIADIGGVDQGEKPDGVLRSDNSKNYSGLLSRIFTSGEWAQAGVISEMSFYKELQMRITTVEQLKAVMIDVIGDKAKVDAVFDGKGDFAMRFRDIVPLFSRASLVRVAAVQYAGAVGMSHEQYIAATDKRADINIAKQAESAAKQAEILSAVSALPGVQNWAKGLRTQGIPADVINKTLSTISNTWLGGFRANFGVNVETTITETFTQWIKKNNHTQKVVDHLGNLVSSTTIQTVTASGTDKTTETAKKLLPVLNVGFDIAKMKGRVSDDFGVHAQAGIDAYAGINGLQIPLSIGGGGTYTAIDTNSNAPLSADTGNVTLGGGINLGVDLLHKGTRGLTVYINLLWNDRIDAIERAGYQYKAILSNIFDDKGMIKAGGFDAAKKTIDAERGALKNPTAVQTLELDMLTTNIRLLEKLQGSALSSEKKLMATAKFLEATVSDHEFIQKAKNSGIHVAGVTDTFSFLTGLMSIGINIQNINAAYTGKTIAEDALSRAEQTTLNYIDTTLQDSQKKYISNEIVVNEKTGVITTKRADAFAQVSAPGVTVAENTDGTYTLTPPTGQKLQLSMLDSRKGALSYKILVAKAIAITPSATPTAVTAPVAQNSVPTEPITPVSQKDNQVLEASTGRSKGFPKSSIDTLLRTTKRGSDFDKVLLLISARDYAAANTRMTASTDKNIQALLKYVGTDTMKMQTLLTYTYVNVVTNKNNTDKDINISKGLYKNSRKPDIIEAEKRLSKDSDSDVMEKKFEGRDYSRTKLSALSELSGQDLSASVFSTRKSTTHRIDDYTSSVDILNKVEPITDTGHRDRLIDRYTKNGDISKYLGNLNKQFQEYATKNKVAYVPLTEPQYIQVLKGDISALPKEFKVTTGAKFFEARACIGIGENACLNKVDGLGYPKFSYQPATPVGVPVIPSTVQPPVTPFNMSPEYGNGASPDAINDPNTSMDSINLGIGVVKTKGVKTINKKREDTTNSEGTTVLQDGNTDDGDGIIVDQPPAGEA